MRPTLLALLWPLAAAANPPVPSGAHPRLFLSPSNLAVHAANLAQSGSAASRVVARCQEAIDHPEYYLERGGADGDNWPGAAVSCAFAYWVTQDAKYLAPALTYWKAALDDDQKLNDHLGCTEANSTFDWRNNWDGNFPPPPVLITVTHDTGYPIRWYGPYLSLVYDWLYSAPGVTDALRTQTRTCLTAWVDNYSLRGYLHDQAGANYNAGFVIAKTLAAVAIGSDGDGHLWSETLNQVFAQLLVGQGLAADPAGVMVGGDWGSWQYGPLSVVEYAAATRVLEENGAPQPEMDAWLNSVMVRYLYGILPAMEGQFFGNGDFDSEEAYQSLTANQVDAVLIGPSSDEAASWALWLKQQHPVSSNFIWNALAEVRAATPADFHAGSPALWYLARGTGNLYARSSWSSGAYWSVFMSGHSGSDHEHFAASNLVFSRGADHLIVDSSNYGEPSTFETNAVSVDASVTPGDYALTQTPWSLASMPWARGTASGVFAARADFAHAFDFNGTPSDVAYAHREWVFLPEGEMVAVDRVHTSAASRSMYVNFHTQAKLTLAGGAASGTVGGSTLTIHPVLLSGGTPQIVQPPVGGCGLSCSFPCGACNAARFAVDEYSLVVPGPWAVAVHVLDGLGAGESAVVGSLNDDLYDPPPKQNAAVLGAAVFRGQKQSYVVASSAQDGASPATLSYGVPSTSAARHIVFDAPEAADGSSTVTAMASGDRCLISISAGSGFVGRPLMFQVGAAKDGCSLTDDPDVPPGMPPVGGGTTGGTGGGTGGTSGGSTTGGSSGGGCGCTLGGQPMTSPLPALLLLLWGLRRRRP